MKLSESLLGAIMVGVGLGLTVGCAPEPEAIESPEIKTTESQAPETTSVGDPQLPVPKWAEDGCPGCGMG